MEDYGIGGAVRMGRLVFSQASRRSGRTARMIERARPGDIIVVGEEAERRRIERILKDEKKPDVRVIVLSPNRHPMDWHGTNPRGAMIFDHSWIEGWWDGKIEGIRAELEMIEQAMSKRPPPPCEEEMTWRFDRYRPLGLPTK